MAVCDDVDTVCRTEAIVNQSLSHSSFLSSSIIDSGDLVLLLSYAACLASEVRSVVDCFSFGSLVVVWLLGTSPVT